MANYNFIVSTKDTGRYLKPRLTKSGNLIIESSNNKKFRKADIKSRRLVKGAGAAAKA